MEECLLYSDPEFFDFLFPGSGDPAAVCEESRRERVRASERFYLEEARSREGTQVKLMQGDMRRFALKETFSTILIPGNSLLHLLTVREQMQGLACVRRRLTTDGRLVVDVANPDVHLLARDPGERYLAFRISKPPRGKSASRKLQATMLPRRSATTRGSLGS